METPRLETLPPPPSVIGAIKAGFDTISTHLMAILLPVALDLFLWLGPHLNVKKAFLPSLDYFSQFARATRTPVNEIERAVEAYSSALERFNLLATLRTFPIGISSLVQGIQPMDTPIGKPQLIHIPTVEGVLGWLILLTLAGWLCGGIYFRWVAGLSLPQEHKIRLGAVGQSFSLSVLFALALLIVGIPLGFLFLLLFAFSPSLAQVTLLIASFLGMWLVVPIFFASHGIFVYSQDMFASILSGIRMARFTLPFSTTFVICVLVINIGLNYLWGLPEVDSWMLLVGIFGHAFITTALLAASFIYYRDTNTWLQTVIERMKSGPIPIQRN